MKEGKEINNEHDGYYLLPPYFTFMYTIWVPGNIKCQCLHCI